MAELYLDGPRPCRATFRATILFPPDADGDGYEYYERKARLCVEHDLPMHLAELGIPAEIRVISIRKGSIILTFAALYALTAQLGDFKEGVSIIRRSALDILGHAFGARWVAIETVSTEGELPASPHRLLSAPMAISAILNVALMLALVWSAVVSTQDKGSEDNNKLLHLEKEVEAANRRLDYALDKLDEARRQSDKTAMRLDVLVSHPIQVLPIQLPATPNLTSMKLKAPVKAR